MATGYKDVRYLLRSANNAHCDSPYMSFTVFIFNAKKGEWPPLLRVGPAAASMSERLSDDLRRDGEGGAGGGSGGEEGPGRGGPSRSSTLEKQTGG
eukprot:CAMPEP_0178725776 /NCGR_PEP_ID=MMETSP0699-20121125/26867_1 /TAXON_ID=265572 /ORGANISM="Extubocellulus spinifer, Strain CCMP396" /LENGTH=95 /DNA_ID=CAMNT_0020377159 /DNA_START=902 /DNA_END=1186 /DNA_ORIENTATION=-